MCWLATGQYLCAMVTPQTTGVGAPSSTTAYGGLTSPPFAAFRSSRFTSPTDLTEPIRYDHTNRALPISELIESALSYLME
jgi:hypothetical protein